MDNDTTFVTTMFALAVGLLAIGVLAMFITLNDLKSASYIIPKQYVESFDLDRSIVEHSDGSVSIIFELKPNS